MSDTALMQAQQILDLLRPLVLVVDGTGTVVSVDGGFGGFLGYDLEGIVGVSVFDYVAPDDVDDLAVYFLESAGAELEVVSMPLPFRVHLVGADNREHPVDVIPAGRDDGTDLWSWVVVIMPLALNTSPSRSLDAEMSGRSRDYVKQMLTEELAVDNENYYARWFMLDLLDESGAVITSREQDGDAAAALSTEFSECGWRPWDLVTDKSMTVITADNLPSRIRDITSDRGWRRMLVAPVWLDGVIVAVYFQLGRVPPEAPADELTSNVRKRIQGLVEMTVLLMARWRDSDRLKLQATRDPLTGLANRSTFSEALATSESHAALLFVDIDHFKSVNDRYGHGVGDEVLIHVAERIVAGCRPHDLVARLGGDEFVVLLDDTDGDQAAVIGERVLDAVGAPISVGEHVLQVSVSIGVARRAPSTDSSDAVGAADQAMLQAKREGRGRLVRSKQLD